MIERPDHVRITNNTKTVIRGRFDSVEYEFRPGEPTDVHSHVARHIFGFGLPDKMPALSRLGWMQTSDQLDKALEKLRQVGFTSAPPLIEAPMPEPVGASAQTLLPQTGGVGPLAKSGEAGGAGNGTPAHPPRK